MKSRVSKNGNNVWLEEIGAYTTCEVEKSFDYDLIDGSFHKGETIKLPIRLGYQNPNAFWMPISGQRVMKRYYGGYTLFGGLHCHGSYDGPYFKTVDHVDALYNNHLMKRESATWNLLNIIKVCSIVTTLQGYVYPLPVKHDAIPRAEAMKNLLEDARHFVAAEVEEHLNSEPFHNASLSGLYPKEINTLPNLPIAYRAEIGKDAGMPIVAMVGAEEAKVYVTVNTQNGLRTYYVEVPALADAYHEIMLEDEDEETSIEEFCVDNKIYPLIAQYILIYLGMYLCPGWKYILQDAQHSTDIKFRPITNVNTSDCVESTDLYVKEYEAWKIPEGSKVAGLDECLTGEDTINNIAERLGD